MNKFFDDFCFAFGIPDSERFALKPSDNIYAIYRHEYPKLGFMCPDALEYEQMAIFMEQQGIDPQILLSEEATIRDLVAAYAGRPKSEQGAAPDR